MASRYTLLTPDYFVGGALIPELVDLVEPQSAMSQALQSSSQQQIYTYLRQYQYDYLEKMFSPEFATAFINGADSDVEPENLALLLEAHSKLFTSLGQDKSSPIAYYVYYYYMRATKTTSTVYGEVDIDFTYGRNANNEIKLMDAWNRMVDLSLPVYLWANSRRAEFSEAGYKIRPSKFLVKKLNRLGI